MTLRSRPVGFGAVERLVGDSDGSRGVAERPGRAAPPPMLTVIDSRCPPGRSPSPRCCAGSVPAMSVGSLVRSGQDDEELFSSVADEDVAVAQDLASGKGRRIGALDHRRVAVSNCQYLWIGVFQATSVPVC